MKKAFTLFLVVVFGVVMCACVANEVISMTGNTPSASIATEQPLPTATPDISSAPATTAPDVTETPTEAPATPIPTQLVDAFISEMGKSVKMKDIISKAAEMIGAVEGKGFFVGDKAFEVYLFDNEDRIAEAKTGKLKLFGDAFMSCNVNGNFVMIYNDPDEDVVAAFLGVK